MIKTPEENIKISIEEQLDTLKEVKLFLYENPEIGGEEEKASAILIGYLREHGFTVTEYFCGIPW